MSYIIDLPRQSENYLWGWNSLCQNIPQKIGNPSRDALRSTLVGSGRHRFADTFGRRSIYRMCDHLTAIRVA